MRSFKKYSCVTPDGQFIYGIHKPVYLAANLREDEAIGSLGEFEDGSKYLNLKNFPEGDVRVAQGKWVYEIGNPFPFRGTTYIDKKWADDAAAGKRTIRLAKRESLSCTRFLQEKNISPELVTSFPRPLLLTLAVCSTDPDDLSMLAEHCCQFVKNSEGKVTGLRYAKVGNRVTAEISDHDLFEAVANNPALPDVYKRAMVLRPGAQGESPIVAEWPKNQSTHVYEYLRENSYIPGGHYAANMAEDSIRYSIADLLPEDMHALRHLYYQRIYHQTALFLDLELSTRKVYSEEELEKLRLQILTEIDSNASDHHQIKNVATLWGWNFGFDYTPTDFRLHASHQQIHQQYSLLPESVSMYPEQDGTEKEKRMSFCCGDLISDFIAVYTSEHQSEFFTDYFKAIRNNTRMDGLKNGPKSLVIWEDDHVMLFVPKAQTSQWEVQLMTKPDKHGNSPGNIFETNTQCRLSCNIGLLKAQQVLARLGATMVTSIEFSKRLGERDRQNQPLLYSLLPKIPYSMGGFSEAQLRFILGHYPEDFAEACRQELAGKENHCLSRPDESG